MKVKYIVPITVEFGVNGHPTERQMQELAAMSVATVIAQTDALDARASVLGETSAERITALVDRAEEISREYVQERSWIVSAIGTPKRPIEYE